MTEATCRGGQPGCLGSPTAQQMDRAVAAIRARWHRVPQAGIILGTGLGQLADQIVPEALVRYEQIPHFPPTTAASHTGQLVCGLLAGLPVAAMAGRAHAYEGHSLATIAFPVRVLARLGIRLLLVSNAGGGMNPRFQRGDVVVIDDHINLMGGGPLAAVGQATVGPRGPARPTPYDRGMIERALQIARHKDFVAHRGVYVAVLGPNYETRAEYRFLRAIGGDVVGMSTVPEVTVAAHLGLRVLAVSAITNVGLADALSATDSHDVISAAERAAAKVQEIVGGILADEASSE